MDLKNIDFNRLIGLNKEQVIDDIGDQFNVYDAKEWKYDFKKNLFYTKFLALYFDENDVIISYKIKFYLNI